LNLKTTWLKEKQLAEKHLKRYKSFSYEDPDGTLYFGYFKSMKAFVGAYLEETGKWGVGAREAGSTSTSAYSMKASMVWRRG
jgi:hypothetical protein